MEITEKKRVCLRTFKKTIHEAEVDPQLLGRGNTLIPVARDRGSPGALLSLL